MTNRRKTTRDLVTLDGASLAQVSGGRVSLVDAKTGKELPMYDTPYTEDDLDGSGSQRRLRWTFPPGTKFVRPKKPKKEEKT